MGWRLLRMSIGALVGAVAGYFAGIGVNSVSQYVFHPGEMRNNSISEVFGALLTGACCMGAGFFAGGLAGLFSPPTRGASPQEKRVARIIATVFCVLLALFVLALTPRIFALVWAILRL
jgi:hypothetical protein